MARTWLSIHVDLISGHGEDLWPRPGRTFAAARTHTFQSLATAIDLAFARWDHAHLHRFDLPDGTAIGSPDLDDDDDVLDSRRVRLSRLHGGEQFVYEFDFGDSWTHLCTISPDRIDPLEHLGITPDHPLPYWGWGTIPSQHGRRYADDTGDDTPPPNPGLTDLPPLLPWWGPHDR